MSVIIKVVDCNIHVHYIAYSLLLLPVNACKQCVFVNLFNHLTDLVLIAWCYFVSSASARYDGLLLWYGLNIWLVEFAWMAIYGRVNMINGNLWNKSTSGMAIYWTSQHEWQSR